MSELDVDSQAAAILGFWFDEVGTDRHFAKDAALDAAIADRFGAARDAVMASEAADWRSSPDHILAAIILLDQFSRNIHRADARAFAADPLALELALSAIAAGHDRALPPERRAFLYMPLMHCEDEGVQRFSQRCFAQPGLERYLGFAVSHADVVRRFDRFPARNATLGRASTGAEEHWLAEDDPGW